MRDGGGGGRGGDINPYRCHLHPKEVMVGVCALCLKEKLLVLASKQPREETLMRKPSIKLGKVFALGSFLQRLEINRQSHERSRDADVNSINGISEASIASLEDSFISIKLEENGHASWHGKKTCTSINTIPYTSVTCGSAALGKGKRSSTAEHGHREGGGPMRWRSRIAQLLQLAQWTRPRKTSSSDVGRFRSGRRSSAWMIKISLTRRRRRGRRRWSTAGQ